MTIPISEEITIKRLLILCALIFTLFVPNFLQATIIHVPADSSTIQAGINGAVNGDTVLVATGHYYERIDFLGKGILVASNFIFDNDTTTIDSTIIDADTLALGINDTGSVVIFVSGEDSNSVITGFTIQNGIGTFPPYEDRSGGSIFCYSSSPTIRNNNITYNRASSGGGISCESYSSPVITNNVIKANSVNHGGGGILCFGHSSPVIRSNSITNNSAGGGGGIACGNSAGTICNNTIADNSAEYSGGGISCWDSSPFIGNNTITGNSAADYGGGISCYDNSSPTISNNTVTSNSATTWGGGISCEFYSSPVIMNNIISTSMDGEGIACKRESYPTIRHNDVWNNPDGNFSNCSDGVGDTTWGVNFNGAPCDSFYNIIRDPLFADTFSYQLLCNSPCIDAGDPSIYVPIDSGGCRIDMGAHEYPYILGDANSDGTITPKGSRVGAVTVGDIVFMINYLFQSGPEPCPYHSADTNCDGEVNIADIVCLINYLFRAGDLPC